MGGWDGFWIMLGLISASEIIAEAIKTLKKR